MRFMTNVFTAAMMLAGLASTLVRGAVASTAADPEGSSMASAVVIQAPNERAGVAAEYRSMGSRFPGFKRGRQDLINQKGCFYDALEIITASGEH